MSSKKITSTVESILIYRVDFHLLKHQKNILMNLVLRHGLDNEELEAIDGVMQLIDHMQDEILLQHGYLTEEEVFDL
jgi:hypothetical protein